MRTTFAYAFQGMLGQDALWWSFRAESSTSLFLAMAYYRLGYRIPADRISPARLARSRCMPKPVSGARLAAGLSVMRRLRQWTVASRFW